MADVTAEVRVTVKINVGDCKGSASFDEVFAFAEKRALDSLRYALRNDDNIEVIGQPIVSAVFSKR